MSPSTRSFLRAAAAAMASKTMEPGSAPSAPRTMSAPDRSAHTCSWSAAAARNVSPAAMTTLRPAAAWALATLPMVVVLPTPFTPTNSQTLGGPGSNRRSRLPLASDFFRSSFSTSSSCPPSVTPSAVARARRASRSRVVVATPTSARIRTSSRSSHVSSETFRPRMPWR